MARTMLHVEDDPILVDLVRMTLESFGFHGEMLTAGSVRGALALLAKRAQAREPVDLILVDVRLPDGSGLEVVREVRRDPVWRLTPTIVLSNETTETVVTEAYALGANVFVPKAGGSRGPLEAIHALYECWMETALLPGPAFAAPDWLPRAVTQRARSSRLCMRMAGALAHEPDQLQFWLNLALSEGNLSNLFAFCKDQGYLDLPAAVVSRVLQLQDERETGLQRAERRTDVPVPAEAARLAVEALAPLDKMLLADVLPHARRDSAVLTAALKAHVAAQLARLASYALRHASEPDLRQQADAMLRLARQVTGPAEDPMSPPTP